MTVAGQVDAETYRRCVDFLVHEADLLDTNELRAWLGLLHPEIAYEVPIRQTRERTSGAGFSTRGFHMKEDMDSLEMRVMRLETEYAWAEDPPSRMRRFVSNFRITDGADHGCDVRARTNLLVFRGRYDQPSFDLISGERDDLLVAEGDGFLLRRRTVLLDFTTLATHNLAFFF